MLTREGYLFVWDTTAPVGTEEWPKKRHDLRNTGNYEEPAGRWRTRRRRHADADRDAGRRHADPDADRDAGRRRRAARCRRSPVGRPRFRGKAQLQIRNASPRQQGPPAVEVAEGHRDDEGRLRRPDHDHRLRALRLRRQREPDRERRHARRRHAATPASPRPCWRENGRGFRYVDKDLTPNGIQQLVLKAGTDGKAQITLKGKGRVAPDPTLPISDLPVTRAARERHAGQCWTATLQHELPQRQAALQSARGD